MTPTTEGRKALQPHPEEISMTADTITPVGDMISRAAEIAQHTERKDAAKAEAQRYREAGDEDSAADCLVEAILHSDEINRLASLPASQAQGEDKQFYAGRLSSCASCGADLSVMRVVACCANPRPDHGYRQALRDLNRMRDDGTIPVAPAPVSAGVDLGALLREGCDLICVEIDALKAGISVNGEVRAYPEDAATLVAIAEFEGWIGRCAAALRTLPPASEGGEGHSMSAVDLDARLRAEIEAMAAEAGVTASDFMRQAVEGLRKARAHPASAMEAEPVAWGESYDGGEFFNTVSLTQSKHHTFPLYAHPQDAESLRGECVDKAEAWDAVAAKNARIAALKAERDRFHDCLMAVSGHLNLPHGESGPCDDPAQYTLVLEGLDTLYHHTEAERVEHSSARFKAEAELQRQYDENVHRIAEQARVEAERDAALARVAGLEAERKGNAK